MYNALDVARYIIDYEATQGRTVSNLRLQKLLYFVQCIFLGILGYACFSDKIEAWDYGPVIPDVYRKYKVYGATMIPSMGTLTSSSLDEKSRFLINQTLNTCATKRTGELVKISHSQAPWKDAYVPGMNNVITQDSIRNYVQR